MSGKTVDQCSSTPNIRGMFVFVILCRSKQKSSVTSQLHLKELPKLFKDPSGGNKLWEFPVLPTTSIKTFDLRHQQQSKRASHLVCMGGRRSISFICGGTGMNRHTGIHNEFQQQLCSDGALMGLVGWTSQWMTKPGLYCKAQNKHELHVNWKAGKHVCIFKPPCPCSWPAETTYDGLQLEPDFHAHIQSILQPIEKAAHAELCINKMVYIDFTPYMNLKWVVSSLSILSLKKTASSIYNISFIEPHDQFCYFGPSHCTHTESFSRSQKRHMPAY